MKLRQLLALIHVQNTDPILRCNISQLERGFLLSPDGGGGGGGEPDDDDDEKKFTQADVDKIISQRIKKLERKYADYDDAVAKAGKVDELTKQLEDLKAQVEDADKKPAEKELARMQRELDALGSKLKQANEAAETAKAGQAQAVKAHNTYRLRSAVSAALTKADALPKRVEQAARLMIEDAEAAIEFDEEGEASYSFSINDMTITSPEEAAKHWLKDNDHYQRHPGGGSGTPSGGSGNGRMSAQQMSEMSAETLIEAGFNQPPK